MMVKVVVSVASFLNCHALSFEVFNLIRSSWTRGSYISCAPLGHCYDWFNSIISEKCVRLEWEAVSKNVLTLDGLTFCCSTRRASVQLQVSGAKTAKKKSGAKDKRAAAVIKTLVMKLGGT